MKKLFSVKRIVITIILSAIFVTSNTNAQPQFKGRSQHLEMINRDKVVLVVKPTVEKVGEEVISDPLELIFENRSEGYKIDHSRLLPSSWVGQYTFQIVARDQANNTANKSIQVTYEPDEIRSTTEQEGFVWVPSSTIAFRDIDHKKAVSTAPILDEFGEPLNGAYDVRAAIKEGSDVSLRINGIEVSPGEWPRLVGAINLNNTNGIFEADIAAHTEADEGEAEVILTIDAPNSPVIMVPVKVWKPKPVFTVTSNSILQGIDTLYAKLTMEDDSRCQLEGSTIKALTHDVFKSPKCFLSWSYPSGLSQGSSVTSLEGKIYSAGTYQVSYFLQMYNYDGAAITVATGNQEISVIPPDGELEFGFQNVPDQITRAVQTVTLSLAQTKGPNCSIFSSLTTAQENSTNQTKCIVEWTKLPDGLAQDSLSETPTLTGIVSKSAENIVQWKVSILDQQGIPFEITTQEAILNLVDPVLPTITFEESVNKSGNILLIPAEGGKIGVASIYPGSANIDLGVTYGADEENVKKLEGYAYKKDTPLRSTVEITTATVGESATIKIKGSYTEYPSLSNELELSSLIIPNSRIQPYLSVNQKEVLSTEQIPLHVKMENPYSDDAYNAETMGQWEIRILQRVSMSNLVPLTDFAVATSGEIDINLDASTLEGSYVRLVAEAKLINVAGIDVRRKSSGSVAVVLLRGNAIVSELKTNTISGPAPLSLIANLALEESDDRNAVGSVTYQISQDDGATWVSTLSSSRNMFRFSKKFDAGVYKLRAVVVNKNSDESYTTEELTIQAFNVPRLYVEAPENVFVGDTAQVTSRATYDGSDLSEDDWALQYSTDKGQTWNDTDKSFTVSQNEEGRLDYYMRARLQDSDADNRDAYSTDRLRVSFRNVRPPRIRVTGSRRIEVGKPYEYSATVLPPYNGMDLNLATEWTLPDGTTSTSETITYTPTGSDAALERINLKVKATIVGKESDGGVREYNMPLRLWEYKWPNWQFAIKKYSNYAPAKVNVRLRTTTSLPYLDEPKYLWVLPSEADIIKDTSATSRDFSLEDAGSYTVQATVSDARGNLQVVSDTIELQVPPPYDMEIRIREGNEYMREPLELRFNPVITGGHPDDRIASYLFYVDGVTVPERYRAATVELEAGEHTLRIEATTEQGHVISKEETVNVNENQKPYCNLIGEILSTAWRYTATCEDNDGRVKEYQWYVDGELKPIYGNRITVSNTGRTEPPAIKIIAKDDSGDESDPAELLP